MLKELKRKDDEFYQTVFDLSWLNRNKDRKDLDKFGKRILKCLTKKYGNKEERKSFSKEVSKEVSYLTKILPQY